MKNSEIFQSFPRLQNYIGGFHRSDSILFIKSKQNDLVEFITNMAADCVRNKFPISYISAVGTYNSYITTVKKAQIIDLNLKTITFQKKLNSVIRSLTKFGKNGCIVIDDLSSLKINLKNEKNLILFYETVIQYSQKNSSIVISTVDRNEVAISTVAILKDLSSVVLDVYQHDDGQYCDLINLKDRYAPLRLSPLKLSVDYLKKLASSKESSAPLEKVINENLQKDLRGTFSSDMMFQKSFQNAGEAMLIFEYDGSFKEPNRKLSELLDYTADELRIK